MDDKHLPIRPSTLPDMVDDALEAISREPWASRIILGGGIALKHYDDFRSTHDIDAWWLGFPDEDIRRLLRDAIAKVAKAHGYSLDHRRFGATDSFEYCNAVTGKREFSFQIAVRDVELDEPLPSPWPPLRIETLRDNIGAKMNALVNRGAPRDFIDIHRVVTDGLLSVADCWGFWRTKNPGGKVEDAKRQILAFLVRIETRRPLESIPDGSERLAAARVRDWFRSDFLV